MGAIGRMIREGRSLSRDTGQAYDPLAVGNPNWSASGSQDQFEAAAAAKRLDSSQAAAQRALASAQLTGADITDPMFDQVEETAAKGFAEQALTMGGNMLKWLNGPFEVVQIFLQDMFGGAAAEGKTDPTFGDYADALWGGLEDPEEFTSRTGLSNSGSDLLGILGWEEADSDDWIGRVTRGIAHFGLDMLTDPLTYVTFGMSGLGRKVAQQGARVFQKTTIKKATGFLDDLAAQGIKKSDDIVRAAKSVGDDVLTPYERSLVMRSAGIQSDFNARYADKMLELGQATDLPLAATARELAFEDAIYREVMRPAISRNFGAIHELAVKDLPGYLRGGARIGFGNLPFAPRKLLEGGIDIPGTRGLGRRLVGDPVRRVHKELGRFDGYKTLSKRLKQIRKGSDLDAPLFDALVDGEIEPWQWTIAMTARDAIHNKEQGQAVHAWLEAASDQIRDLADEGGFAFDEMLASLHRRIETDEISVVGDALGATAAREGVEFSAAADKRLNELAIRLKETYRIYYDQMANLDPEFAEHFIRDYVPHLPTQESREFLAGLMEVGAAVDLETMANSNDVGVALFARLAAGMGHAGNPAIDDAVGSVRFINRDMGRVPVQQMSVDGGPVLLSKDFMRKLLEGGVVDPEAIETGYLTAKQINDALEPVLKDLGEKFDVPLGKWNGRFLSENPIELAREYTQSMTDSIQGWEMVEALKSAGLVTRKNKVIDTPAVVEHLKRNVLSMADALEDNPGRVGISFQQALDALTPNSKKQMAALGLNATADEVSNLARLYERLRGGGREGFRQMGRGSTTEDAAQDWLLNELPNWEVIDQVFRETDEGILQIATNPNTGQQVMNVQLFDRSVVPNQLISELEREFMSGSLKGRLTHDGIEELFMSGAMSDDTADLLYSYLGRKMDTLDGRFVEHLLSANPVEANSTRWLYDEFEEAVHEFTSTYSGRYDDAGRVIPGQLHGDKTTRQKLDKLRDMGKTLKKRGVHEVGEIMAEVDDMTVGHSIKGYISPERLGLGGKALDDMQVQENAAMFLRNLAKNSQVLNSPEGVKAAKIATNDFLKNWRGLVTLARPTFHIRNAVGAGWMNSLMGVRNQSYQRLNAGVHKFRNALFDIIDDDDTVRSVGEMVDHAISQIDEVDQAAFRAMWDEGVLSGFVDTEFRTHFQELGQEGRLDWANVWDVDKFFLTKWGGNVMQNIEDYARGSLFLEYFEEGVEGSSKVARDLVNAVHFDYNNLTPWETRVKSWVPFFVWTRRNIPRQLSLMVENPGMIQKYQHMMEALNDNLGGRDETGFPHGDHFSASAAGTDIFVNPNTPFWARVMIDPDLPVNDLLEIPNPLKPAEVIDWANGLLGPHVTALFDLNNQREFGDVNAPAPFNGVMRSLAAAGFFDATADGDVRIPYYARTLMELALPFAREVIDPITGGPTDPGRQQRLGVAEDDNWLEGAAKSVAFTLARGAGVKLSTPTDARQVNARNREEISQILSELELSGDL